MTDTEALSDRIDQLEMRLTHQEATIDDLNKTVTAQWKQIDALTRHLAILRDRVKEAEENAGLLPHKEPPPPHY
ncbi:SlyX family protein [Microvirga terricola]|uniref:Protein SlyX homolog n=1 Tax=Microvirga terricola TaxID=2719797 RepID=A0ABX0V924_9HYPH|nr:SlyX family protein [Microvirga terricola]NIX75761.1 SlyX family protein [Microvirga terricola]